ncbi:glycosyltransferase family 4 protein [Lysobacter sp. LF1]|uniref:Glycosyltransferase family 4 protein n=1 Tax=Lysobacter stagni TaxID=3045172 RepID=A0ABT6XFN5_9GAMM|nr:glycosyltransferase family 4 protein [Lysobacter sp. LF1]MDI9238728.1 glycosyltransferase family 4 protein [Lysobacter sp. LF1]
MLITPLVNREPIAAPLELQVKKNGRSGRSLSATVSRAGRWAASQSWLLAAYKLMPMRIRQGVSSTFGAHVQRSLGFERTARWDEDVAFWRPEREPSAPSDDGIGVNLVGYFSGQFGLAESARAYAKALIDAGCPISLHEADIDVPHSMGDRTMRSLMGAGARHGVDIVFVNPDHFASALERMPVGSRRPRIVGFWFWELAEVPRQWLPAIEAVDEIMVATEFVADAFRAVTDKPVTTINYPLQIPISSRLARSDFGIPENAYAFLCTFDFNSAIERKNPMAVVRAFRAAFASGRDDFFLMIKSSNGGRQPDQLRRLLDEIGDDQRIQVRDDVIEGHHLHALQHACDAYVSLHRAEGLGLGMAESMRIGKPVVATGWSGNMAFMNERNSLLVDYTLTQVEAGQYPNATGMLWAEPNLDSAASLMRKLADDREWGRNIGRRAAVDIAETLSPARSADAMMRWLTTVDTSGVHPHGQQQS